MLNLFITIGLTTIIFIIFKLFYIFRINVITAIVINYFVCVATGLLYSGFSTTKVAGPNYAWLIPAVLMGMLFAFTFYLMALTVEKVNMTIATVANKISLIIPVSAAILFFDTQAKEYSFLNYMGIFTGIISIILSSIRKPELSETKTNRLNLFLPFAIFLLGGTMDLLLNIINYHLLTIETRPVFTIATFLFAAITGSLFLTIRLKHFKVTKKDFLAGIGLGIPNFFSIYFLLQALADFNNDGAFFFPILNIGIILSSGIVAYVFFKERLSFLNISGMFLAILALLMIFS